LYLPCYCLEPPAYLFISSRAKGAQRGLVGQVRCYEEAGGPPLAGCSCHESCQTCGYSTHPITANDCLSCRDPSMVVNAVDENGRGTCSYTPCIAFCEPDLR
jgi:hypothetical protein